MKILVAEDDPTTQRMLQLLLTRRGHEVVMANDGSQAWAILQQPGSPHLAILDWMMPGLDGVEICRLARTLSNLPPLYFILCTTRDSSEDIVAGLESGANDYITKPFDHKELIARVHVGQKYIELQLKLKDRVQQLEHALEQVNQLQKLLPICSYCKKIRDDHNYWQQVESYLGIHAEMKFSHSICPECYKQIVQPQLDELESQPIPPKCDDLPSK